MNRYERALSHVRERTPAPPAFETIAAASDDARQRWAAEVESRRTRAGRWLLAAAPLWLILIVITTLRWHEPGDLPWNLAATTLPTLLLVWAARLCHESTFRAALLTRGIAFSHLLVALMWAHAAECTEAVVFALGMTMAMGRSLGLLGAIGLDGSSDPDSSFEPVRFRGLLSLALIMACVDAMLLLTFGFSGVVVELALAMLELGDVVDPMPLLLLLLGFAAMVVNVWGLVRLRTWALFTNMLTNIAVAAMALTDMLWLGPLLIAMLVTTAIIQLLLPLPILATALGRPLPERREWLMGFVMRIVVPVLVGLTVVRALFPIERWQQPPFW